MTEKSHVVGIGTDIVLGAVNEEALSSHRLCCNSGRVEGCTSHLNERQMTDTREANTNQTIRRRKIFLIVVRNSVSFGSTRMVALWSASRITEEEDYL